MRRSPRPPLPLALLPLLVACALAGCASKHGHIPPEPPTLKSLEGRGVAVSPDAGIAPSEEQAIAAYRKFLDVAPHAPQRAEAMRRIADLEMDGADRRSAADANGASPDYRAAIARYEEYLKAYPHDPSNDRVLYQLARAHEQGGELEAAMATLDRLVAQYPATTHRDEAQFRRGEMLFAMRAYAKAEQAYATVLQGPSSNPYHERALYMHGWSLFKQGRLEEALHSYFRVLDLKVADREGEGGLDTLQGLTRADRELVEDTFRVTSLCLANLQGAESIAPYMNTPVRRSYEFRVYEQLGELYLRQERVKDAADTFGLFARRHPLHERAPQLQTRVIEIYQQGGFGTLALEAKKEYVVRYGITSDFRRAHPQAWGRVKPLVKAHLGELARYQHAQAQKTKASADVDEAVRWYRAWLESFPSDAEAPQNRFLLAELLFENQRDAEAITEYEKTAYGDPPHARSADAGYSALLAYARQEQRAAPGERPAVQRKAVASALRFADAFGTDARTGAVLTNAAEKLFALNDAQQAEQVAQRVVALKPAAAAAQRRVAWTVIAHTSFDRGAYDRAERAYGEVLALVGDKEPGRAELVERLAASVYKQGEQAREAGDWRGAVGHFDRVATVAPQSAVRATAQYDAAAALIALKDWDAAARKLEDFRTRYPQHPLQAEVGSKLTLAYMEQGRWSQAAHELERVAVGSRDATLAREALWQAAELHDKGASRAAAARAYESYLRKYPQPLERAVEARWRLAGIAHAEGQPARELALMKEVFQADQRGDAARTPRTRYLGGMAALALAEPVAQGYRKVALVEPLARQLKLKKARMEEALKAYAVAADYGVADVTTAATFHTASLYQDFGRALLASERPKKLSKLEREQYDVMLEEQAYPFEEKALELHEVNARRATAGIYDAWVQRSFAALRELRPVRYGKNERSEGAIDAIR
jgi:cellulose synthase operon protein C